MVQYSARCNYSAVTCNLLAIVALRSKSNELVALKRFNQLLSPEVKKVGSLAKKTCYCSEEILRRCSLRENQPSGFELGHICTLHTSLPPGSLPPLNSVKAPGGRLRGLVECAGTHTTAGESGAGFGRSGLVAVKLCGG